MRGGWERLGRWWVFVAGWGFVVGKTASCAARVLTIATYAVGGDAVRWADWRRSDCEDRLCSLMVVGCGLVTAGVTLGVTGFVPLVRHVRSRLLAPVRLEELA
jgi:hypothetical protein